MEQLAIKYGTTDFTSLRRFDKSIISVMTIF